MKDVSDVLPFDARDALVIPDLHGRSDLLRTLLRTYKSAPLIFLGDYVDRGPDSPGVISLVRALVEDGRAVALMGNHDEVFCQGVLDRAASRSWWDTYLTDTTEQFSSHAAAAEAALWLRYNLREHLQVGGAYLSHADIHDPQDPNGTQRGFKYHLWARSLDEDERLPLPEGCRFSVHGHTVTHTLPGGTYGQPLVHQFPDGPAHFLDLGAFATGLLSVLRLKDQHTTILRSA